MIKLDDNLLLELGLGALSPEDKKKMLAHIYETLEMRVGMELAKQMTDEQLREFEEFINRNDEAGALRWLETNFPNYKDVVAAEFEKLKQEVRQLAPQILASNQQHHQQMQQGAPGTYAQPGHGHPNSGPHPGYAPHPGAYQPQPPMAPAPQQGGYPPQQHPAPQQYAAPDPYQYQQPVVPHHPAAPLHQGYGAAVQPQQASVPPSYQQPGHPQQQQHPAPHQPAPGQHPAPQQPQQGAGAQDDYGLAA